MEEPSHAAHVRRELQDYDPNLDIHMNLQRGLWEVRVKGGRTRSWHHVFFWADGAHPNYVYRSLPPTAKPLLEKLYEIDTLKYGNKPVTEMIRRGLSERRAQAVQRRHQDWRERLGEYRRYLTPAKLVELNRRVNMGGLSREQAMEDRRKAIMEILVPSEEERIIVPR